jgi:hypothetical protein
MACATDDANRERAAARRQSGAAGGRAGGRTHSRAAHAVGSPRLRLVDRPQHDAPLNPPRLQRRGRSHLAPIPFSPDPTSGRAWLPCCRSRLRPTDPDDRADRRATPSRGARAHACAARSRPAHGVGGRAGGNPKPTRAHLRFDDLHVHVRQCRARVQRPRGRAHARRLLFRGGGRRRSGRFWPRRCGESRRRRGRGASGRRRGEDDEPALQLACEARAERVHLRPAAKRPWLGPGPFVGRD